jgi:hypothetical protein
MTNRLVTFQVNKKASQTRSKKVLKSVDTATYIGQVNKSKIESAASVAGKLVQRDFANPFVNAAHIAFEDHYPLILSPDAVWLVIAQGFGHHINMNPEELRPHFVNHEGKQLIKVVRNNFVKGNPNNDWQGCFGEFSDKLSNYIGKKRDLFVSNFSTTGVVEKAASEVVLMSAMKNYFKFQLMTKCGIPEISLTGTVEDWKNIRTRAQVLSEYKCEWWIDQLIPSLDHFVSMAEGNPNIEYWDNFYKSSGGSGGPYVNGWINTFFPYVEGYNGDMKVNDYCKNWNNGGWGGGPSPDNFTNGISTVPFKWQYHDTIYDMEFGAGFVGVSQDETTLEVTPSIGWIVKDLKSLSL